MKPVAWFLAGLVLSWMPCSCRSASDNGPKITKAEFERLKAEYEKKKKEQEARKSAPKANPKKSAAPTAPGFPEETAPEGAGDDDGAPAVARVESRVAASSAQGAKTPSGPWILDETAPVAPAGPAAATAIGVVLYNRRDELHVARLGRATGGNLSRPTNIVAIAKSAAPFPLGRAPAVSNGYAYWVTAGRLVRRPLSAKFQGGPMEILATDARDGTRVAVPIALPSGPHASLPAMAAYIVRADKEDGPLRAKLWVEGAAPQLLTPEGSSTHSIVLVATDDGVLAISLAARMSMTPVHAQHIRFAGGLPVPDEDIVVWVGGGVQPLTEITALRDRETVFGFLPHERSITEFGLAKLDIGLKPDMDTPMSWIAYPNGIDPAPVATGSVCGEPAVLYAQPANPEPDAQQELVLRSVGARGSGAAQSLATAKAFYDVSLCDLPGGALVAYVADWVTWAVTVRCRPDHGSRH